MERKDKKLFQVWFDPKDRKTLTGLSRKLDRDCSAVVRFLVRNAGSVLLPKAEK